LGLIGRWLIVAGRALLQRAEPQCKLHMPYFSDSNAIANGETVFITRKRRFRFLAVLSVLRSSIFAKATMDRNAAGASQRGSAF